MRLLVLGAYHIPLYLYPIDDILRVSKESPIVKKIFSWKEVY